MSHDGGEFDPVQLRDLAQACSRREFVAAFARDSMGDIAVAIARMADAGESQRWSDVRDRAHAIKGIAANIGAVRLVACADAVMKRRDEQMPSAWAEDLRQLREHSENARSALESLLRRIGEWAPHG